MIVQAVALQAHGDRDQAVHVLDDDTVKGHNRKIFGKLQVQRRTDAVARARELGLA